MSDNDVLAFQKDTAEPGLRLVTENADVIERPIDKQFVNFLFLRVNPEWRKLNAETKRIYKSEFQSVFDSFRDDFLLYSYSLVGFDAKADMMFWRIGESLDVVQDMTAKLYRTTLGSFIETTANYLSVTKRMMFTGGPSADRLRVEAGGSKYHFVYPCAKSREWFDIPADERDAMIEENFMVGKRFPNIKIHLTHAFGFTDDEYLISFETDEPRDFLALAEELRQSPASKFTLHGLPIYTCRQRTLMECLDALG
ncbi:MAG: chlorite dismutase family protein [Pyrinomonadaceae bacterium]